MTATLKLAESKPERTPERAALAEAIEKSQALLEQVNLTQVAIRYAQDEVRRGKANVAKFEKQLADAKSDQAQILIARAMGETRSVQTTARDARRSLENAADDLSATEEAEAELIEKLKSLQADLSSFAGPKVRECALKVIQTDPQTIAFIKRFAEVERLYLSALAFINNCPTMHCEHIHALIGDRKFDPNTATAIWKSWEISLREDPDAQMPRATCE
jgi:hypothetical protein